MAFFRIAKTFEVEYGHRLSKHPEKCRFPHGHSLRIEVVVRGRELDDHDMVCDYKALKMIVADIVKRLDHAMALNSSDPQLEALSAIDDRLLLFDDCDPTTEVLARWIYEQMADPKWVIAMGDCASTGGLFNNYAVVQGVDEVLPVDLYIAGCPSRPEALLHGILTLHHQILSGEYTHRE